MLDVIYHIINNIHYYIALLWPTPILAVYLCNSWEVGLTLNNIYYILL